MANPQEPLPPVPEPTVEEQLREQIHQLTSNQNELINTIRQMKEKADDPFLAFRTPDPIKNLPNFSGNRKETLAWLEDTENTLKLFEMYHGTPMFQQILRAAKNKITGEAKEILIAAGNPNDWPSIKEILLNSYGDRRDLTSHIQSLFYIRQGKKNLTEYYNKVKAIDTAIKSTAAAMDDYKHSTRAINSLIGLMSLTRFIDGLDDQISMHVRSYRPQSLEEAYTITMQYSNAAYRQKFDRPTTSGTYPQPENKFKTQKFNQNGTRQNTANQLPTNSNKPFPPTQVAPNNRSYSDKFRSQNNSGKFKQNQKGLDEDASMRSHVSKMQINAHEENIEPEPDTSSQLDDSTLESDDDDYFVDDEINFHVEEVTGIRS